jgi:glycerol-3-phosphate acyltransferase PlsX
MISVAIDASGGQHGLPVMVAGAAAASLDEGGTRAVEILLVGDERRITDELSRLRHNPERIGVIDCGAGTSAASAVKLASEGRASAVISAGASSALVAACRELLTPLPGVRRPALSAVYPTALRHGQIGDPFALLLDVGVAPEASADDLVSYALLGSIYARAMSQNASPRVALLSSGADISEAPTAVVEAAMRLARTRGLSYVGFLEAVDIPKGIADVVVCDGFAGNTVIKLLDGVRDLVLNLASYAQKQKLLWKVGVGMLSGVLSRVKIITDWEQYGGAPLLGYPQLVLRAHPQSNAHAIHNACRVAAKAAAADLPRSYAELIKNAQGATP